MKKLFNILFGRSQCPIPITLNDCYLLHQMGYDIELSDGQISKIIKSKSPKQRGLTSWMRIEN